VEEQLQAEMLDQAGCDFVQGYLYSRPIPAEQLDAILRHGAMGR
jgi:EAL domain-containing protein (putative c-di-GMP-specific phosphodiesterase class I)